MNIMNRSLDLEKLNRRFASATAAEIIRWAHEEFGESLVMTSAFGDRSALTLHFVTTIIPNIPVIVLDPRFFFPETREFMERLMKRFRLNIRAYHAGMDPELMRHMYETNWKYSEAGMRQYNMIRKEEPLAIAFAHLKARAWITGVRGYQTSHRGKLKIVERYGHGKYGVYKIHPFLAMTEKDVAAYFTKHSLPYHPLVAQGYDSIGDEYITKPGKGREGRAALGSDTECGLHCRV